MDGGSIMPPAPAPARRCHSAVDVAVADEEAPGLRKDPLSNPGYEMSQAGKG